MFFKILNDSVESNGLVPTLLIFGVYLFMTDMNALSSTIKQCSRAIYKVMEEVRRSHIFYQVNDILNT